MKKDFTSRRPPKRKAGGHHGGERKKNTPSPPTETEETSNDQPADILSLIAIDNQVSGDLAVPVDTTNTALVAKSQPLQNEWILDTGCTNHSTGTLSHFTDLVRGDFGTCGGVGGSVKFEGKGTVRIPIPGLNGRETILELKDVKFCPSMGPFNLISISQIFKTGRAKPVLTEDSLSWKMGKTKVNASAKHGLWLLDQA